MIKTFVFYSLVLVTSATVIIGGLRVAPTVRGWLEPTATMVDARRIHADSTGPQAATDAGVIAFYAETSGVPAPVALAIAWEETRTNTSPNVRGSRGEWGRFQILETTARGRCPGMNIETTRGNRSCFLKMLRENYLRCGGWDCAVRIHNGAGAAAGAYADRVLTTARLLVAKEIGA